MSINKEDRLQVLGIGIIMLVVSWAGYFGGIWFALGAFGVIAVVAALITE